MNKYGSGGEGFCLGGSFGFCAPFLLAFRRQEMRKKVLVEKIPNYGRAYLNP